jgi:hypothetical protein
VNVIQAILWVFSWLAFAYFVVYGLCQIAFTLVAWKRLAAGRHARAFSPLDEIYFSPFTPPVSIIPRPTTRRPASWRRSTRCSTFGIRTTR